MAQGSPRYFIRKIFKLVTGKHPVNRAIFWGLEKKITDKNFSRV